MLALTPSVQSPAAYDRANLTAAALGARLEAGADATLRANIRAVLADQGFRYRIHPAEQVAGLTDADLTFGYDPFTPHRYGAVGDGVADDTAAFQTAVECAEAGANQAVLVEEGTYLIGGTVTMHQGVAIIGKGSQGSTPGYGFSVLHDSNADCFVWDGNGATAAGTGGGLRNCVIVKQTGRSGGRAIYAVATDDDHRPGEMIVDNVLIYGTGTGLWAAPIEIDGTAADTAGSRGIRSTHFRKVRVASASTNNGYVLLKQATHCIGDIQIDTGNGTGTLGMTISDKWDQIQLLLRGAGSVVVNYSGSDNPRLNLSGSCDSVDINSAAVVGIVDMTTGAGVTSQSKFVKVRGNQVDNVHARVGATVANATGDGTAYTVVFGTESFDYNATFDAATGIETVKIAGRRMVTARVVLAGLGASHTTGDIQIIHQDSGGSVLGSYSQKYNVGAMRDAANQCGLAISELLDCSEGDTIRVNVVVSGSTKTVGVGGASTHYSTFNSALVN